MMSKIEKSKPSFVFYLISSIIWIFSIIYPIWSKGGRIPTYAENGMVVSDSEIASKVGCDILQHGGNVIDAAVATAFALAVTWPAAGNIGGGGFMLYHTSSGNITSFDFREKAPLAATKDMFLTKAGSIRANSNHEGYLSIGVPGTVAGLYKAHHLYGKKPWPELLTPAINLAREGFQMTWGVYESLTNPTVKSRLQKYPSSFKIFYKSNSRTFLPGENWQQPQLAETLKRIQQNGHQGFYSGETALRLTQFIQTNGGLLTLEDLTRYTAVEREPIQGTYRDFQVFSMAPPSSGGIVLIEMLNILEGFNLPQIGFNSAFYNHILTETMRRAYADRARYLGDPDFNHSMPVEMLTSKSYAEILRNSIDQVYASKSDSALFNQTYQDEETTHISIMDNKGNAVAVTYTLEFSFGSGIVADGLGFLLNNEMGDFNAVPGLTNTNGSIGTTPNLVTGEKRMLSSMTPSIVAKEGQPILVIGSPGGRTIINTVLQVILNFIDHKMNIAEAIEAGRIHHQWLPDVTSVEKWALSLDTERLYKKMGHQIKYRKSQGKVMGISRNIQKGILSGAADSRSPDGAAVGF